MHLLTTKIALSLCTLIAAANFQETAVPLKDVKPTSAAVNNGVSKAVGIFSMGGLVFDQGIKISAKPGATTRPVSVFVYSLPTGSQSFRGAIGFDDADPSVETSTEVSFSLDGEVVKSFTIGRNEKPQPFDIEVGKSKTIRIAGAGAYCLGNPSFLLAPKATVDKPKTDKPSTDIPPTDKPATAMLPVKLTAPLAGTIVKDRVTIVWTPSPGATMYSIEFVLISVNDATRPISKPLRAYSTKGDRFELQIADDMVNGDYQVSVIAFGKRGVITKFSAPLRIRVLR